MRSANRIAASSTFGRLAYDDGRDEDKGLRLIHQIAVSILRGVAEGPCGRSGTHGLGK